MAPLTFSDLLNNPFTRLPPSETLRRDLSGKRIMVIGGNAGLGFEASKSLASMNPERIILACRNPAKAKAAAQVIQDSTDCKRIEAWDLDLSKFASVIAFVNKVETDGERLDIVLNNAAMFTTTYSETDDGWDTSLQVNYLAGALLSILLLPTLLKSSQPSSRFVSVTSSLHHLAKFPASENSDVLEKLNDQEYSQAHLSGRYAVTKMLQLFWTRSLASRLPETAPLTVNCVSPGWCETSLLREVRGWFTNILLRPFYFLFARSAEEGSRTLVHAALAPEKEVHGRYLYDCEVREASDFAISEKGWKMEERIWHETIKILSKVDDRVLGIVQRYLGKGAQ